MGDDAYQRVDGLTFRKAANSFTNSGSTERFDQLEISRAVFDRPQWVLGRILVALGQGRGHIVELTRQKRIKAMRRMFVVLNA